MGDDTSSEVTLGTNQGDIIVQSFPVYGRIGYEAYAAETGGLTYDGKKMPEWDELPDRIRKAWAFAATAIRAAE